jgi:uncharacterized protein (TIGR02284 family)
MLRSELQIALNDVQVALQEAADGHEWAADFVPDPQLGDLLRELALERRSLAEALGEQLKALGDLPRAPDTDLETVRDLVSRIKAAFSPDERQALLDDRAAAEARLEACAETVLARDDLPEDALALLREILERARLAKERMGARPAP